jgi:hypothetical protein
MTIIKNRGKNAPEKKIINNIIYIFGANLWVIHCSSIIVNFMSSFFSFNSYQSRLAVGCFLVCFKALIDGKIKQRHIYILSFSGDAFCQFRTFKQKPSPFLTEVGVVLHNPNLQLMSSLLFIFI